MQKITLIFAGILLVSFAHADEKTELPAPPIVNQPALSLADALRLAQTDNVTLAQTRADAESAAAAAQSAQAQTQPSLSTTTYASIGDSSNILTTSPGVMPQNLFAVPSRGFADQDLMLMVPLFTGGKLQNASAAAQAQGAAARLAVGGTQLTVTETVTEDYADAALQQALVAVTQSQLDTENEQVRETQEKVTTGRLAPVDLLREQAAQAEAQQALLAAQNNAAMTLVQLKTDMGVSQASMLTLTDTLDTLAAVPVALPATLPDALRAADTARPELAAAAKQTVAAQEAVQQAQGAFAPQVYGVAMGDAMSGQDMNRLGYTLGITASLPLADGGQRRADVRQARARLHRVQADAEQVRQQVDQEVASAWLALQTATAEVAASGAGVTAAQEGYTLADLRYNAGKSIISDRLAALAALVSAQAAQAQAKAALVAARARLHAALGES